MPTPQKQPKRRRCGEGSLMAPKAFEPGFAKPVDVSLR